ncbi:hypothetical protein RHSP_41690 (plasmid) [Rhizobium freirei PRF 81]|uniref:Uncharacterized protein n=1 Tax=Rhizobium freirei PRF 81 TaxID=363754 RepID=N6UYD1_9HYPH|nr:hypothetical protein RHSP_41690 [Rhizobium freirei PRF 81]
MVGPSDVGMDLTGLEILDVGDGGLVRFGPGDHEDAWTDGDGVIDHSLCGGEVGRGSRRELHRLAVVVKLEVKGQISKAGFIDLADGWEDIAGHAGSLSRTIG